LHNFGFRRKPIYCRCASPHLEGQSLRAPWVVEFARSSSSLPSIYAKDELP